MASVVDMHRASSNNNDSSSTATNYNSKWTTATELAMTTTHNEPVTAAVSEREQIAMSFAKDSEEQSYVLLHLIRVLALYLYVYVAQNPLLVDDVLLHYGATDLAAHVSTLERELHAMLLAFVEAEVASNQFDGLVQEKHAFGAIKRLFRAQRVKATTQCATLAALLATYLSLLQAPIVTCAPFSMVISTLEYLAKGSSAKDVALPLLYPIVNAIDSLRIEQRECLDALTTLWKQLAASDSSNVLLAKIVRHHHAVIIEVASSESAAADGCKTLASTRADLGACFVTTLLEHSDHIFRRDPEYSDFDAPLGSDTEDDEPVEDASESETLTVETPRAPVVAAPVTPVTLKTAPISTPIPTLPRLTAAEVEVATPSPRCQQKQKQKQQQQAAVAKGLSKSMRRRKKKADDKQQLVGAGASVPSSPTKKQQHKEQVLADSDSVPASMAATATDPASASPQSLPTAICVGIAAAAGTIAAALCVIFT